MNTNKKIMIIEDNLIFTKVLEKRLRAAGYETYAVQEGMESIRRVKLYKPDLILLDLLLPGLDGHKICHFLKFDAKLKNIPVVILTSRDTEGDASLSESARADAYLLKTVHPAVLLSVIGRLIEQYEHYEVDRISFHGEELKILKRMPDPVHEDAF